MGAFTCELGHPVRENGSHIREADRDDHREDLTTPEQLLHRSALHAASNPLFDLWVRPVRGPYARIVHTADKPIGDLTVPEAMDWALCLGYAGLTGYVIGKAIGNLLEVALGGRRRLFCSADSP